MFFPDDAVRVAALSEYGERWVSDLPTVTPRASGDWGTAPWRKFLCKEILGYVFASNYQGRHRARSASRSAAGVC